MTCILLSGATGFVGGATARRLLEDDRVDRLVLLARQLGSDFTPEVEAAFLNGATSAFFACKSQDRLPSSWVFGRGPLALT